MLAFRALAHPVNESDLTFRPPLRNNLHVRYLAGRFWFENKAVVPQNTVVTGVKLQGTRLKWFS